MRVRLSIVFVLLVVPSLSASAISIELDYRGSLGLSPAFDPNGTRLKQLFDYAVDFYQDVFHDAHTIENQLLVCGVSQCLYIL